MNKEAQDLMQNVETSGGCDPTDPACFLKEYFPKYSGLDELLNSDISFLGGSYSTIRDIYNEHVDKSLAGQEIVFPEAAAEDAIDKIQKQIIELDTELKKLNPIILEMIMDLADNPDTSEEDFIKKYLSEPQTESELKKDKFSSYKDTGFYKKASSKDVIEKITPVKATIVAKYILAASKKSKDIEATIAASSTFSFDLNAILGQRQIIALAKEIGKTPLRKALEAAGTVGLEKFLGSFWITSTLTTILTMLSLLTLNFIAGMFAPFDLGDLIMLIAELAASAAFGAGIGAILFTAVKLKRIYDKLKTVAKIIKKLTKTSNDVNEKMIPAGRKLAKLIKKLSPKMHDDLCKDAVQGIPGYTASDADRILTTSQIVKKNNLKLLQLKKFLIQNGFKTEANMI